MAFTAASRPSTGWPGAPCPGLSDCGAYTTTAGPRAASHDGDAVAGAAADAPAVAGVVELIEPAAVAELAGEVADELGPLELQAASANAAHTRIGANAHRLFRSP